MANQTEESTAAETETAGATRLDRLRYRVVEGDLGRRLVHVAGTGFPAIYVLPFIEWWHVVALMAVVTAGAVLLETVRLSVGLDWFIYEHLTREYEQDAPAAYLLYMISATAVAAIAEPRIAIPAILMLTIGDPISGVLSADELRPVKRPKGLAVMFVTCVLLSVPFVPENLLAPTAPEVLAIALGGTGGMVADGVKPVVRGYVIDDDLTIAPAGAVGIWVGLQVGAALL
jgi:dolichol kinase